MTNKVVGICPCCFREIAVQRGLMVHHGYERHTGYHTSSCEAAFRFKPLEVSREGLQWLLVVTENSQYRDKKRLGDKAGWPLIYEGEVPKVTMIARGDPGWELAVERDARRLEEKIESRGREIERLARQLKEWRPTPWPSRFQPVSRGA